MTNPSRLKEAAAGVRDEVAAFCRRLIQAPSETGDEAAAAAVFRAELERLGLDDVQVDGFGNVVGRVPGVAAGGNLLLCGHLDQVGVDAHFPGREGAWPHPPFAAHVGDGWIWGRGASDVKGSLAAQVHAAGVLKTAGARGTGDLIVAGVVHDEAAFPLGIRHLCEETLPRLGWRIEAAVAGPATGLDVALGHMGKVELDLHVEGVSRHVSRAAEAVNPIVEARTLIDILERIRRDLPASGALGREIMAPTIIGTPNAKSQLIPAECVVTINWRFPPGRTRTEIIASLERAIATAAGANPRFRCRVRERAMTVCSYAGAEMTVGASCDPFLMAESHPFVGRVVAALRAAGQDPALTTWPVPTHAGYLGGTLGLPTVGYSPCEYRFNHTPEDRVAIDALVEATLGYAAIAAGLEGA